MHLTPTLARQRGTNATRSAHSLTDSRFDVVIIGGGSFGAAAARYAALRGLRTALIERDDFGSGASAECFKMVHGGIRYLQHADIARARGSCRERSAFLRTAPHLVKPLPIAIPTYGHGRRGKLLLASRHAGVSTCSPAIGIEASAIATRRIGPGTFLSRRETLDLFPHLDDPRPHGCSGIRRWTNAQSRAARACVRRNRAARWRNRSATISKRRTSYSRATPSAGSKSIDRLTGDPSTIKARSWCSTLPGLGRVLAAAIAHVFRLMAARAVFARCLFHR